MADKFDQFLNVQRQALGLRAQRQQILAANIANADTPNYKARDIDFQSVLTQSLAGKSQAQGVDLARTNGRHLAGTGATSPFSAMYRRDVQMSVDGNTVDMDTERAAFAENSLRYEAAVTFLSSQFRTMQAAVQNN